jgi:predicted ATP-grasp superfamily ATP-dependent carboligase
VRIFVYEYISGGGLLAAGPAEPIPESLLREGMAMLSAVLADLSAIPDMRVTTLRDARLTESWQHMGASHVVVREVTTVAKELAAFDELAGAADGTLVIAPEIGGALLSRCQRVEQIGGRLFGPSSAVISIAADKQVTAEWLAAANVPVPLGCSLEAGQRLPTDFPYPAVLKPRDGAGSQDVRYLAEAPPLNNSQPVRFPARIEKFRPGTPVSVAMLCGPERRVALPPCRQRLSDDGEFRYLGGDCPLAPHLAERARSLASRAVNTLPQPRGYLGVDLVLGERLDGRDDVVIEINPRLTTSYVGLRRLAQQNLAAAMLDVLMRKEASLSFEPGQVQFEADGTVTFFD